MMTNNEQLQLMNDSSIISVEDGDDFYSRGEGDDTFKLDGSCFSGGLDGREGSNTLDISQYALDKERIDISLSTVLPSTRGDIFLIDSNQLPNEGLIMAQSDIENCEAVIKNVDNIIGREGRFDSIAISTYTHAKVDGRGGEDSLYLSTWCKIKKCKPIEVTLHHKDTVIELSPDQNQNFIENPTRVSGKKILYRVAYGKSGEAIVVLPEIGSSGFAHCDSHAIIFSYSLSELNSLTWGKTVGVKAHINGQSQLAMKYILKNRFEEGKKWGISAEGKDGNRFTVNLIARDYTCHLFPEVRLTDRIIPYPYEQNETLIPYAYYPLSNASSVLNHKLNYTELNRNGRIQFSSYIQRDNRSHHGRNLMWMGFAPGIVLLILIIGLAIFLCRPHCCIKNRLKKEDLTQFLKELKKFDSRYLTSIERIELDETKRMIQERLSNGEHNDNILCKQLRDAKNILKSERLFIFSNKNDDSLPENMDFSKFAIV